MRIRRRNTPWLVTLGLLVALVVVSGVATAEVAATLIGLYLFALAASLIEFQPTRVIERSRSSLTSIRMSAEAREAVERARRRGGAASPGLTLLNVGLISTETSSEGMNFRITRSPSLDEDGVRPFIKLHVQPDYADRHSVIRYEIIDANGDVQYVHEMRTYLRDGEMDILADHQLPLLRSERRLSPGDWDLRVTIDGVLFGLHSFTVAPSLNERYRRLDADEEAPAAARPGQRLADDVTPLRESDEPMSLEELLRQRSNQERR
jgi:hypothetical protein